MRSSTLIQVGLVSLAFGMDWLPLLGDRPEHEAARLMRRQRASHAVLSGLAPSAVGLAWLGPVRNGTPCFSGAQIFAGLYPKGTVAIILDLADGRVCVLASHEGVVLSRSDRIYHDIALARAVIDELRLAYPRLTEPVCLEGHDEPVSPRLLASHAGNHALLRRVPTSRRRVLVLGGLTALSGAFWAWPHVADTQGRPERPDALEAWGQAQRQLFAQHPVHGLVGTQTLFGAMARQPVTIAGWQLRILSFRVIEQGQCRALAEYERTDPRADNKGLLQGAPSNWQFDFPSLTLARAGWTLALPAQTLDQAQPPVTGQQTRDWVSQVQAILPAFSAVRVDARRSLSPVPPRDADGQELVRPADIRLYAVRDLRFDGPLRAGLLVMSISRHIGWRRASLSIEHPAGRSGQAGLMKLQLEGGLYETQEL